mmetsp:Transcript_23425/g.32692  ORF Transcript_23425/g.32692 Transcript_23425/m.32692 type:complete len:101 (+) Transcript_23425:798-1100(+)
MPFLAFGPVFALRIPPRLLSHQIANQNTSESSGQGPEMAGNLAKKKMKERRKRSSVDRRDRGGANGKCTRKEQLSLGSLRMSLARIESLKEATEKDMLCT